MPTHAKKKIILGLVGEIASGKDTVAEYLKKIMVLQPLVFPNRLEIF